MRLGRILSLLSLAAMLNQGQLTGEGRPTDTAASVLPSQVSEESVIAPGFARTPRQSVLRTGSVRMDTFTVISGDMSAPRVPVSPQTPPTADAFIKLVEAPGLNIYTPESIVSGSLFDSYGNPVADEPVYLSSLTLHRHESTLTESHGLFVFPPLPPGDDYRLAVTPARFYRQFSIEPFVITPPRCSVDVVLQVFPRGTVSGYLIDSDGMAVSDIGMVIYSDAQGTSSIKVQTDDNGWFSANDVAAGHLTFAIEAPAYLPIHSLLLREDESLFVSIVLDKQWKALAVRTVAEDDAALPVIHAGISPGVATSNSIDW